MNKPQGFTMVELLVALIIVSILAAIALPAFLNQVAKARESEAKQYIGTINRAQQVHFAERRNFASDVAALGLGIQTQTVNYSYAISTQSWTGVVNLAYPRNIGTMRAYVGAVQPNKSPVLEATTLSQLCESDKPRAANLNAVLLTPIGSGAGPQCQNGFTPLLSKL